MSSDFVLDAAKRTDMGKGASRRLRRLASEVPAIVYGGKAEAQPITLKHNKVLQALEHEAFYSSLLTLTIDGKKETVVLKDMQRHPFKPKIAHMDFMRVSANEPITMRVPVHFLNLEECPGIKAGGIATTHQDDVGVRCLPKDLPEYIELDCGELELDQTFHLSDLTLPKGVESVFLTAETPDDRPLIAIHMPKVVEEPEEEVAEEGAEAAEGEEAAAEGGEEAASEGDAESEGKA